MKAYEKNGVAVLRHVVEMMKGEELKEKARKNEKDFTRQRKIGFFQLLCLIIRMIRKSTQLELDEFREMFMPESAKATTYTKQSFSEARQKLDPVAFTLLNDELVRAFYEENDFKTYKGFRLLAVDGSVLELPNTKEMRTIYGFSHINKSGAPVARALSSHLYDIENRLVIGSCMSRYSDNEREMAKQNIKKLLSNDQQNIRNLILFDRGYPSSDFINFLQKNDIHYMMRSPGSFFKEIRYTTKPDELVNIEITKERARELTRQGITIPVGTILHVRVLKVILATGETEILLTNLSPTELSYEESKSLYFKRWGIETRFNALKHKFEIENFSGITPLLIEQDFYATMFLSNLASIFEQDAEEEMRENQRFQTLKYTEYRINKNILVGKIKNRLIEMILEEDDTKKDILHDKFLKELQRNIVPVIDNRSYKRAKQSRTNKFLNTKRRGL